MVQPGGAGLGPTNGKRGQGGTLQLQQALVDKRGLLGRVQAVSPPQKRPVQADACTSGSSTLGHTFTRTRTILTTHLRADRGFVGSHYQDLVLGLPAAS